MASTTLLKCGQNYCDFETNDPATFAEHVQDSSTDGTRWECQGEDCNKVYCTTKALDGKDRHHKTCDSFQQYRKKQKYGQALTGRLEAISRTSEAVLNGTASPEDAPQAKFFGKVVVPSRKRRHAVVSSPDAEDGEAGTGEGEQNGSAAEEGPMSKRKRVWVSKTTESQANATPAAYGCTLCDIEFDHMDLAQKHATQSNQDLGRWVCMGCEAAFCESEKELVPSHIEKCAEMKGWMKRTNIAWPRHLDSDFVDMVNQSQVRRTSSDRKVRFARATALKVSRAQASTALTMPAQLVTQAAVWDGRSWYGDEVRDTVPAMHDRHRLGFLYVPGTFITIPTETDPLKQALNPLGPTRGEVEDAQALFGLTPLSNPRAWTPEEIIILGDD